MRHVLQVSLKDGQEQMERLPKYEIISIVVKKILALVLIKIQNSQTDPLVNNDRILIYELAAICQMMCHQCSLFEWSKLDVI